jgi:hypothetical protein
VDDVAVCLTEVVKLLWMNWTISLEKRLAVGPSEDIDLLELEAVANKHPLVIHVPDHAKS